MELRKSVPSIGRGVEMCASYDSCGDGAGE
jgi:hypothetical protein